MRGWRASRVLCQQVYQRVGDAKDPIGVGRHAAELQASSERQKQRAYADEMAGHLPEMAEGAMPAYQSEMINRGSGRLSGEAFMKMLSAAQYYDFSALEAAMDGADLTEIMSEVVGGLRFHRGRLQSAEYDTVEPVKSFEGDHQHMPTFMWALSQFHDHKEPVLAGPLMGMDRRIILLSHPKSYLQNASASASQLLICDPVVNSRSTEIVTTWETCPCFPGVVVRTARHASISFTYWSASPFGDNSVRRVDTITAIALQRGLDYLQHKYIFDRQHGENAVVPAAEYLARRAAFDAEVDVPGDHCNVLDPPAQT